MGISKSLSIANLTREVAIYPLATFRVLFGAIMLFSTIRFWLNGWIEDFYITPTHFFPYAGLEWIQPYSVGFVYILFFIIALSALGILLGAFFRVSSVLFFLSFTYVELIDKTTYLNHYYFISLVAFLLMFMPCHRALSVDAKLFPRIKAFTIQRWSILALQLQIAVVYFFAGLAKLNYDWLFKAQPMSLWLESQKHVPFLGEILAHDFTAFAFSWAGMLFDISIAFLLFSKKLRPLGYALVVIFHLFTWFLFPIGVFPWVMMGLTLIFFSGEWHQRMWSFFLKSQTELSTLAQAQVSASKQVKPAFFLVPLGVYFFVQAALPLRHLAYDGDLYWSEEGYRFSWRVMLMEKTGHLTYVVKDVASQRESIVPLENYFTPFQQRQMVTQPDMIVQGAQHIAKDFEHKGIQVEVFAQSYASLNGSEHQTFINPQIDLTSLSMNSSSACVLPLHE